MKKTLTGLFILSLIVTMQNCGKGNFASPKSVSSLGTSSDLSVLRSGSSDQAITVDVRASAALLRNAKSVLWDHVFGEDLTYCEQTTTADKSVTTFLCPGEGWLTVSLFIEYLDGTQVTKQAQIYLSPTGASQGGHEDEMTGAQLYTLYCSGCHGALNVSTKRGVTLERLNSALNSQSAMTGLKNQLTDETKSAIVQALQ